MRRTTAATAAAVAALVLAGCSSSPSAQRTSPSRAGPAPTTTTGSPSAPRIAPLTGSATKVANRPALVVKIENSSAARPQAGLAGADLVIEELVEGGITRFAAMYQSSDPGRVGPVRSLRAVDASIASPTRGLLAASGGAGVVLRQLRRAPVQLLLPASSPKAFSRSASRPVPHNLYADTSALWSRAAAGHRQPPPPYLPFAPSAAAATTARSGAAATHRVTLRFSSSARPSWTYDAGSRSWLRSEGGRPAVDSGGHRLRADGVLVLRVRTKDAGYRDPIGNPVPETVLTGSGPLTVLTAGERVNGLWHKANRDAPFTFTTTDGHPLLVAPGRSWLELLPTSGAVAFS